MSRKATSDNRFIPSKPSRATQFALGEIDKAVSLIETLSGPADQLGVATLLLTYSDDLLLAARQQIDRAHSKAVRP